MQKVITLFIALWIGLAGLLGAGELEIGMQAPDWKFKDADGKEFSMASWSGQVLLITYVDPDKADLNDHFTDAMKKAKEEGVLKEGTYKGIGIADCAATWKPNMLIRSIAGRKAKRYNTTILFDYDATLRKTWGLKKDTSNAILLDKQRVCRAIVRGRVPDGEVAQLVQLAAKLQAE